MHRVLIYPVGTYCFAAQVLVVASHTPPALSQLALSVAFVTSPANAGPVKARARVTTSAEMRETGIAEEYCVNA